MNELTDEFLLLLRLRDAISCKEWVTACANRETAQFGAWSADWGEGIREAQERIDEILKLFEKTPPQESP